MVRPRTVSQWGPNAQGVRSRPDRSVDLRDAVPQQMGVHHLPTSGMPPPPAQGTEAFNWWRYDLLLRGRSDADLDAEIDEVEEWLADPPADEVGIGLEENAESRLERALAEKARRVAEAAGEAEEEGAEGVDEAEMRAVPSLGPQVLPQNVPVPNFQGPQVHAMTGDLEGQQELPWGRRPQGLAGVQGARDVLGGAVPWTPNPENVVRPHVGGEPPPLPPPVSPMISQMAGPMDYPDWRGDLDDWVPPDEEWSPEGGPEDLWNPESQMDRQYMAEMAAQRGAQPEHGFWGTLGGLAGGAAGFLGDAFSTLQAVNQQSGVPHAQAAQAQLGAFENASTEDKLAIVLLGLAAAAASTGVGGSLAPPLLAGSAALAGQP